MTLLQLHERGWTIEEHLAWKKFLDATMVVTFEKGDKAKQVAARITAVEAQIEQAEKALTLLNVIKETIK
jgi:hypothetical protein